MASRPQPWRWPMAHVPVHSLRPFLSSLWYVRLPCPDFKPLSAHASLVRYMETAGTTPPDGPPFTSVYAMPPATPLTKNSIVPRSMSTSTPTTSPSENAVRYDLEEELCHISAVPWNAQHDGVLPR